MVSRFRVLVLVLALALAAVSATPTFAAKGGGGGKGGGGTTTATLTVSPNPAAAGGSTYQIAGCGYSNAAAPWIYIVHSAGYTEKWGGWVNLGCLTATFTTAEAGTYTIQIYQALGGGKTMTLVSSATLTVQ